MQTIYEKLLFLGVFLFIYKRIISYVVTLKLLEMRQIDGQT